MGTITRRIVCAVVCLLAALAMFAVAGDSVLKEAVHFASGASGTTVSGRISGYQSAEYTLRAEAGQQMSAALHADNSSCYFNIYAPGRGPGDEAMFIGSLSGSRYQGTLPADGEYIVQVYMMRSAARRNEITNFTLDFAIDGPSR